jgi:hypothetical protein
MTPHDELVHEFVRDLNRWRQNADEQTRRDVPQVGTDEWHLYMKRTQSLSDERDDLLSRLSDLIVWD